MSDTRKALMHELLEFRDTGRTIDELSRALGITRTAVQQHVVGLERDGLVSTIDRRRTGGRPSRAYGLTARGHEEFPRSYAVLAQELLATAAETLGDEAVEGLLMTMAEKIAEKAASQLESTPGRDRLEAVVELMNELGYAASVHTGRDGISAANCIYHKVAEQTRAVCRYDVRLLSLLLGEEVSRTCCMLDGDRRCVFQLGARSVTSPSVEEGPSRRMHR